MFAYLGCMQKKILRVHRLSLYADFYNDASLTNIIDITSLQHSIIIKMDIA